MVAVAAAVFPMAAHANGRVGEFVTRVAGPYEIALGTIPDPPVVGSLHLTMTVADSTSRVPILDADVTVTGSGPVSDAVEIGPLETQRSPTTPLFYDVSTSVDRVGTWIFTVSVVGDLGEAATDFALKVETANPAYRVVTWVTIVAFFAVLGLGLLPLLRKRGKRGKRKRTRRRRS